MKVKVYVIQDRLMKVYHTPQFIPNDACAIRSLSDTLKRDKEGLFAGHPTDFGLYRIGEYDDFAGCIVPEPSPQLVCDFSDLLKD